MREFPRARMRNIPHLHRAKSLNTANYAQTCVAHGVLNHRRMATSRCVSGPTEARPFGRALRLPLALSRADASLMKLYFDLEAIAVGVTALGIPAVVV
jgi:hypothetical protein